MDITDTNHEILSNNSILYFLSIIGFLDPKSYNVNPKSYNSFKNKISQLFYPYLY